MKQLKMFTSVWGDTHISWMDKSLIRSLCWPKNKEALKDATWDMWAKKSEQDKITPLCEKVGVKKLVFHDLPEYLVGTPPEMGLILLKALLKVMRECIDDNAALLTAPPDTFFSEGTVPNLLKLGRFGNTCVAVPHARVTPSIFDRIGDEPLSGADLITHLFKHQHRSWSSSEIGVIDQSSFIGGIAWQDLGPGLYGVQHRLPTVYLSNFVESDISFFQTRHEGPSIEPVYGAWDHLWPMKLVQEERQRLPGSSDVCCLLEVTKADQNVPGRTMVNHLEPDSFWRNAPHNQHNRQTIYIMRSN